MESLGYAAHIRTPDNTLCPGVGGSRRLPQLHLSTDVVNLTQPLERRYPNPYVGELIQKREALGPQAIRGLRAGHSLGGPAQLADAYGKPD